MSPPLTARLRRAAAGPLGRGWRWAASERSERSLLREEDSRWASLLRNLGGTPEGQLKALQLVDSQHVLEQKQFQRLLDDVAQQLPRDVGEKTAWESRAELAAVLRKLNVQSLHQRLGARLNNALLQDSDAKLESLMENFCGEVADDYTLWLLNRKLEGLVDSLKFDELVSFLHLMVPWGSSNASSSNRVVLRVRQQLAEPQALSAKTWAKLMQIYGQEAAPIQAWEILDALALELDISHWKLPELAVLGSTLESHGLPKRSKVAETVLEKVLPQVSKDSDVELTLLCISGGLSHRPSAEMSQKTVAALQRLSPGAASEALQLLALLLRLWRHWPKVLELPTRWSEAHFSPALMAQLLPLCAGAGVRFTGTAPGAATSPPSLVSLQPLVSRLDAEAAAVASRLEIKDFCSVAFSLARLGSDRTNDFLLAGDLDTRLAAGPPLSPSSLARLCWAMAAEGASSVAWALLQTQLKQLPGSEMDAEDQALLFEALGSQAVFDPKSFEGPQVWKEWAETWSSMAYMPRSQHLTSVTPLLSHLQDDTEVDVPIGGSPWNAPILFTSKKIILDLLPTARHPASGKTRGDLTLKHHTWAESGHTVLVIPDPEWPMEPEEVVEGEELKESQKARLKWIKDKVEQLHKRILLQQHPLDEEVKKILLTLELGPRGINADALTKLAELPEKNQRSAVNKYKATLKDWVKNPSAWLIGITKEEKKSIAQGTSGSTSAPQQESPEKGPKDNAAARRPQEGWSRDGRGLDQVRVGESLMGKVTNIFKGRVWADVGLVKDGSFLYEGAETLKVGQIFRNLKVIRVDRKRNWVELQPQKPRPVPDSPRVPLAKRPSGGWGHKEGTLLADLQVGAVVSGKVTNVLYDRVWVDVGAECDATFKKPSDRMFKVGDTVSGTVAYVDVKTAKKALRIKPADDAVAAA